MRPEARLRGRLALAIALGVLAAGPARADPSATNAPPAERFEVSPGGVDMRSGRYVYSQTDLAIGGDAGLAFTRTLAQQVLGHASPFGNFSHNWEILLSEKRVDVEHGKFGAHDGGGDFQIEIAYGGLSQTFRSSLSGYYQVSRSGFGQLSWTGGSDRSGSGIVYTFQGSDGTTAVFHAIGTLASAECSTELRCAYVQQITRADGTVLDFDYDTSGGAHAARLRTVTSSRGYALMLEYSSGLVSKACVLNLAVAPVPSNHLCPSGAQAMSSYTYTTSGGANVLASATGPGGATRGFGYGSGTMSFTNPGESTPWLVNHVQDRADDDGLVTQIVSSQNFADGSSYSYSFDESPMVVGHVSTLAGGSFTDAQSHTVTLTYDFPTLPHPSSQGYGNIPDDGGDSAVHQMSPGPVIITDQLGRATHFDYCDPYAAANLPAGELNRCLVTPMPVSTTGPTGIKTVYTNDYSNRNVLGTRRIANVSGPADIVGTATYDCSPTMFRSCARPTSLTDANGNVTNYTYSADHGGVLTETPPAPTSGAARPQIRHIYAQRYAWVSNGSGGYVHGGGPIWVEVATSLCRTSAATGNPAAPCATTGDEVLTQIDYGPDSGPNTLVVRGQTVTSTDGGTATTLRTCYSYDALGRRISQTAPNANPSSCP
jgi:YD repeat-containing protein